MILLKLAAKSIWNRKVSLSLAMISIAISILLLLGVDKIRKETKDNFINTISQTDLIVGARSGSVNLLLYSVFRIGNATHNLSYQSYQEIAAMPRVKWTIPISLGDSHRGFRVMGTNQDYFRYYRYSNQKPLAFKQGQQFTDLYDAVIGYEVAKQLNYQLGQEVIIAHGLVSTAFSLHDDKPFKVVGILQQTGTPVDHTIHVSLQGIEAIHVDWQTGTRSAISISAEKARTMDLQPKTITAFMLGLERKIDTFRLQRQINQYRAEPLMAILPGATLAELWQMIGQFEKVLMLISGFVLVAGLIGLLTTLLTTINERRREMAILRTVGAHGYHIGLLFMLEAIFIVAGGCGLGVVLFYIVQIMLQSWLSASYGLYLTISLLDTQQWMILGAAILFGMLLSLLPAWLAYRYSLQDGLMVKN
ncbi:FtsX-like permease family protein [Candidatus Albibeggiatoa sp. nov. NOAA]|uniref:ABC transporter permease n=1 Tax=Candidatus Albibeggiatoa sp. nov. NOAA TaxID=3162724 RepID=UPI0032F7F1E9|nr:ABC transporter permease [Thiotrichaceae bacterium]